ncbi:DUF429 domain-containing protein [Roseibium sp. RKSG952]|uniref:DUF429 domain-containing protein n=1 Tax=Roseibium sp. RKSG952 TaxID=2529384 RepID=UPI0012BD0AE1|nr:DUF429 domain-containing protein [Roseibium sp. RKSG952]MTH97824.1 DUF429 domain-containing protein [Roseibium sp. RKSG952]
MADPLADIWVAGVDGCKAGWIAVLKPVLGSGQPVLRCFESFSEVLDCTPNLSVIAVDMPIGLPDTVGLGGRGPEQAVRKHLGMRQSSVFSVPSRAAVYCEDYPEACRVALQTSDPPRKVSKQAFHLFPKIREIDALLTPAHEDRVFEVHPELAFWRLNGGTEMSLPKKVKSRPNPAGLNQRRDLLVTCGFEAGFLDENPPRGVGRDDLLDAAANCLIADRIWRGLAFPFPAKFERDARGTRIAIWA